MKSWLMVIPWLWMGACDEKTSCTEDTGLSCDTGDADADTDTDTDTDVDADTDADVDLVDDADLSFSAVAHPCTGNRTDALWTDSTQELWVGCGTTTVGKGLFHSSDGGDEWTSVTGFEQMRVNHLWRSSATGPLYASGNATDGDQRVVAYDGSLEAIWNNGSISEMSFSVGAFGIDAEGTAVAESLTGNGVVVRDEGSAWRSGYGWWGSAGYAAVQIMDLTVANGVIVGAGSVVGQPSVVYLPPRAWRFGELDEEGERATHLWEVVELFGETGIVTGELWGMDGDRHGLVVGGVDQVEGSGTIWTIGLDWEDAAYDGTAWNFTDVGSTLGTALPTWIRGVCRRGDRVAAVGEYSSLGDGLVLISQDGGLSFDDRTMEVEAAIEGGTGLGPLHRCQFLSNGELIVAGSGGRIIRHLQ